MSTPSCFKRLEILQPTDTERKISFGVNHPIILDKYHTRLNIAPFHNRSYETGLHNCHFSLCCVWITRLTWHIFSKMLAQLFLANSQVKIPKKSTFVILGQCPIETTLNHNVSNKTFLINASNGSCSTSVSWFTEFSRSLFNTPSHRPLIDGASCRVKETLEARALFVSPKVIIKDAVETCKIFTRSPEFIVFVINLSLLSFCHVLSLLLARLESA